VPAATAILDRFLQQAEILQINGKSYRLRHRKGPAWVLGLRSRRALSPAPPRQCIKSPGRCHGRAIPSGAEHQGLSF
jgi:hypothetical protein